MLMNAREKREGGAGTVGIYECEKAGREGRGRRLSGMAARDVAARA